MAYKTFSLEQNVPVPEIGATLSWTPHSATLWGILGAPTSCFVGAGTTQGKPDPVLSRASRNRGQRCAPTLGGAQSQKQCSRNTSHHPRRCWALLTPQPIAFPLGCSRCRKKAFFQTPNQVPAAFKTQPVGCLHPLSYHYTEFKCEREDLGVEPSFCHRTQLHIFHYSSHFMSTGYRADPVEAVPIWLQEFRRPIRLL